MYHHAWSSPAFLIAHLILTVPRWGVIIPVTDKETGLKRVNHFSMILQPSRHSQSVFCTSHRTLRQGSRGKKPGSALKESTVNGGGRQPTTHCHVTGSMRREKLRCEA
jgi:hypothetical protein